MKKKKGEFNIDVFNDGIIIRTHNARVCLNIKEDVVVLNSRLVNENADTPCALHRSHRGKVRETQLAFSSASFYAILKGYAEYLRAEERKQFIYTEHETTNPDIT